MFPSILEEHLFLSEYLHVVVVCLDVLHLVNRHDTDIAAFANNDTVTLFRLADFLRQKRLRVCLLISLITMLEPFLNSFFETFLAERLQQIIDRPRFKSLDSILIKGCSKDHCRRLFNQFQHFEAVDLRHLDIQENKIGFVLRYSFDPFEAIVAFLCNGYLWKSLQIFSYNTSRQRLIIY